jgi:hypothetical protein
VSDFPNRNKSRRLLPAGILGLVFLGAVIGSVLLWWRPRENAAAWPSVARSELVMRAGRWCAVGGTNLFTGWMVERYPDGPLQSRSAIADGLLNGVCEGWYTNGQVKIQEHFKNSVSDGPREKWFPNGRLESHASIVNGAIEGTFRRWHDNGQLAEQIEMKNGQPDGVAWEFYPSGFIKAKTHSSNGKVLDRHLWSDGQFMASAATN